MKQLVAFIILVASSTAMAQPGAAPGQPSLAPVAQTGAAPRCSVTIARAPDDVRKIIESWVQAEPNCTVKLELRVVPTEGGYYLLARDEYGRVRERVVPDAQSAGVLVASWMAADSHDGQTPYDIRKPAPAPAAPAAVPAQIGSEQLALDNAPGLTPVVAVTKPARKRESRWLSIGGMVAMGEGDGGGLRTEWDAGQKGRFTLGFLASVSQSVMRYYDPSSYDYMGTLQAVDAKVLSFAAMTARSGGWALRGSLGLGLVYTSASMGNDYAASRTADGVFPTGELALSVNRDLGDHWAVSLGPILSLYAQTYELVDSSGYYSATETRAADVMMHFALRYRL